MTGRARPLASIRRASGLEGIVSKDLVSDQGELIMVAKFGQSFEFNLMDE